MSSVNVTKCHPVDDLAETYRSIIECGLNSICTLKGQCSQVTLGMSCPCKYPYRCIERLCRVCIPGARAETPMANFQCSRDGEWQLLDSSMDFHTQLMITIVVVLLSLLLFVTFGRWVRAKYEVFEGNRRKANESAAEKIRRKRRSSTDTSDGSDEEDEEESNDDDDSNGDEESNEDSDEDEEKRSDEEDDSNDEVEVTESDTDHRKQCRRGSNIKNYSSEDDSEDGNSDSE